MEIIKKRVIQNSLAQKILSLSASQFFLFSSLFWGMGLVFFTPPFQVADEEAHYKRTVQVAQGHFIGTKYEQEQIAGGEVLFNTMQIVSLIDAIPFNYQAKMTLERLGHAWKIPYQEGPGGKHNFSNTVIYSPTLYWPQSISVAIANALKLPPLLTFYLARLMTLIASSVLLCWGISQLPHFQWSCCFLLLLPINLFTRASVSADVMNTTYVFLWCALLFQGIFQRERFFSNSYAYLPLMGILLALSKQTYLVLFGLLFLVRPQDLIFHKKNLLFWFINVLTPLCFFILWSQSIKDVFVVTRFDHFHDLIKPKEQFFYALKNPFHFIYITLKSYWHWHEHIWHQFLGLLGWMDTPLHRYWRRILIVLLPLLIFLEGREVHFSWKKKIYVLFLIVSGLLLLSLAMYMSWTPYAENIVRGLGGRYLIPLCFMALLLWTSKRKRENSFLPHILSLSLCIALGFQTWVMVLKRYYHFFN